MPRKAPFTVLNQESKSIVGWVGFRSRAKGLNRLCSMSRIVLASIHQGSTNLSYNSGLWLFYLDGRAASTGMRSAPALGHSYSLRFAIHTFLVLSRSVAMP